MLIRAGKNFLTNFMTGLLFVLLLATGYHLLGSAIRIENNITLLTSFYFNSI